MSTTHSKWTGWWVLTVALVALSLAAIGCRAERRPTDGDSIGPPTEVPSFEGASREPGRVLRDLGRAQRAFRHEALVDEDTDGEGEFAGLAELTGASGGRMERPLRDPLVWRELGQLNTDGEGELEGYLYRVWLPGRAGLGIGEMWRGAGAAQYAPSLAENYWVCYAWPVRRGGGPAYFLSHDGVLLRTNDPSYAGRGNGPAAGAALAGGDVSDVLARPADGGKGADGNTWVRAD